MTEGVSFAGMAEIPIVIVVSQRTVYFYRPSATPPARRISSSCCTPGRENFPGSS